MQRLLITAALLVAMGCTASLARAQEPGWTGVVIARGALREQIHATPILERNYRPFHFYGNTVRRRYYRCRTLPSAGDVLRGGFALFFRR